MPFIKKLVIKGFKSFPKETEIPLDRTMNVIVGPNGSGKSNITDAICFVLGRLSIKSMRAAKAAHLIFAGTKSHKPSSEAFVEMVFDNSDKSFSLDEKEISLKRIVRQNGQSIYKINSQVKTRQEVLELLAQAGIDPHGFNIILQGEISSFVQMHAEERRKIIEEVAGISVYETRKLRSLKELEKTEEKIKEVIAILKERTSYLKNLEQERQQALKFKKLEETVKKCKASILKKKIVDKEKERNKIDEEKHRKAKELDKLKIIIGRTSEEIKKNNQRIEEINNQIQKSSGLEVTSLHDKISELRAEIAGLNVRKENFQNQTEEIDRRNSELKKNIENFEKEIEEIKKSKGKYRKPTLEIKKKQLSEIEDKRRKLYSLKSSLSLIDERLRDKEKALSRTETEVSFVMRKLEETESELRFKENSEGNLKILSDLKKQTEENKNNLSEFEKRILELEKKISASETQIKDLIKIKSEVSKIDVCPLCKTKITRQHKGHIEKEANEKISLLKKEVDESEKAKNKLWEEKETQILRIKSSEKEIEQREIHEIKLENIKEKKETLKKLAIEKQDIQKEIEEILDRKKSLEKSLSEFKNIEENYESLNLELQELARHEEIDVGMEITMKQRELERMKLIIKQASREKEELEKEIQEITQQLEEKESQVEENEFQEARVREKYKRMLEEKTKLQDKIRLFESDMLKKQNSERLIEDEINILKIKIAEINAQLEALSEEFREFEKTEILQGSVELLQEKLQKTQEILNTIGTVNLRALEVYDKIKQEYQQIALKVEQLEKEKQEILKIIEEIDKKKKKAFNETLEKVNALFSRNFSQLSTKGIAFLEPENKEDIFSAGLDIIIKVSRGKYFDVTSLSGGEQTLIALALIFAVQEYSPYCFYIFDEIDAALDKRNSERLALLLKKHMKSGQYIMITHNDAIISESTTLYGVSMQDGISKILSLQV